MFTIREAILQVANVRRSTVNLGEMYGMIVGYHHLGADPSCASLHPMHRQVASQFLWQDLYSTNVVPLKCPDFVWFKQSARVVLVPVLWLRSSYVLPRCLLRLLESSTQKWISPFWWLNIFVNPNMRKILEVMACLCMLHIFQGNDVNQTKSKKDSNVWPCSQRVCLKIGYPKNPWFLSIIFPVETATNWVWRPPFPDKPIPTDAFHDMIIP